MSKPPDHSKARKKRAQKHGRWAEGLTRVYLMAHGHRILAANYKTKVGEVDLIARRGNVISFVEVKARATKARAAEAVTPRQQSRIQRAAEYFLTTKPHLQTCDIRFDVALVTGTFRVELVRDAWRP